MIKDWFGPGLHAPAGPAVTAPVEETIIGNDAETRRALLPTVNNVGNVVGTTLALTVPTEAVAALDSAILDRAEEEAALAAARAVEETWARAVGALVALYPTAEREARALGAGRWALGAGRWALYHDRSGSGIAREGEAPGEGEGVKTSDGGGPGGRRSATPPARSRDGARNAGGSLGGRAADSATRRSDL